MKNQVGGGIAWEKGGGQIVNKQLGRHLLEILFFLAAIRTGGIL